MKTGVRRILDDAALIGGIGQLTHDTHPLTVERMSGECDIPLLFVKLR